MKKKQTEQARGRRGLRWLVKTTGRNRIVWGHTKEHALAQAKLDAGPRGEEVLSIEPLPADKRNEPRGGTRSEMLAIRLTEEEMDALKEKYGKVHGRMSQEILKRLLED